MQCFNEITIITKTTSFVGFGLIKKYVFYFTSFKAILFLKNVIRQLIKNENGFDVARSFLFCNAYKKLITKELNNENYLQK